MERNNDRSIEEDFRELISQFEFDDDLQQRLALCEEQISLEAVCDSLHLSQEKYSSRLSQRVPANLVEIVQEEIHDYKQCFLEGYQQLYHQLKLFPDPPLKWKIKRFFGETSAGFLHFFSGGKIIIVYKPLEEIKKENLAHTYRQLNQFFDTQKSKIVEVIVNKYLQMQEGNLR